MDGDVAVSIGNIDVTLGIQSHIGGSVERLGHSYDCCSLCFCEGCESGYAHIGLGRIEVAESSLLFIIMAVETGIACLSPVSQLKQDIALIVELAYDVHRDVCHHVGVIRSSDTEVADRDHSSAELADIISFRIELDDRVRASSDLEEDVVMLVAETAGDTCIENVGRELLREIGDEFIFETATLVGDGHVFFSVVIAFHCLHGVTPFFSQV